MSSNNIKFYLQQANAEKKEKPSEPHINYNDLLF